MGKLFVCKSLMGKWLVIEQAECTVDDVILSSHPNFEEAIATAFIYVKRARVGGSY